MRLSLWAVTAAQWRRSHRADWLWSRPLATRILRRSP